MSGRGRERAGGGTRGSKGRAVAGAADDSTLPPTVIVTGQLLRGDCAEAGSVVIEHGQIVELAYGTALNDPAARHSHIPQGLILPGLIDLHVHGIGGYAVFADREQLRWAGRKLAACGVTGFLASVPVLPWDMMQQACRMLAAATADRDPPNLLGIHVEGPHLSPARPGSQSPSLLRPASLADYRALRAAGGNALRVMTIAPELPGAHEVIEACRRDGTVAAMGHTNADFEQAQAGFEAGITHVTHLYNAMRGFHHRSPGAIAAALVRPGVTAELILDGEHIARGAWELARRALGPERLVLVSDQLPCSGAGQDARLWDGRPVRPAGRRLTLDDGTLAGSAISLLDAVWKARQWGAGWAEAVAGASRVPASVLGLGARKGNLLPGMDGDLCVVAPGQEPQVLLTLIGGRVVAGLAET